MTYCQYCAGSPGASSCAKPVVGRAGWPPVIYYCTRAPGHDGPCVACGAGDDEHDLTGAAPDEPNIRPAPASLDARRCVCVRSVPAGGSFPYYSPAVLVERVTKDGRRVWRMLDNRPVDQDFRSRDKAIKAAEEIAADLGIPVVLDARHNRPVNADN